VFDSRHGCSVKTVGPFVKRPGRQADLSPRACAEIKSEWSHISIRFPTCLHCTQFINQFACYLPQCSLYRWCRSTSNNCGLPACTVHVEVLCVFTNSNRLTQHFLITIHNQLHVSALFNQQQAVFSCRRGSATASVRQLQMCPQLLSHHTAL